MPWSSGEAPERRRGRFQPDPPWTSHLGLSAESRLDADLRRLGRVDGREPARILDQRRLEGGASFRHLFPGALHAELAGLVGHDRERKRDELWHGLAVQDLDR